MDIRKARQISAMRTSYSAEWRCNAYVVLFLSRDPYDKRLAASLLQTLSRKDTL